MKTQTIIILGALAALGILVMRRSVAGQAVLPGAQYELSTGHVIDTGNGVIYDPTTGDYVNVLTGQVIFRGFR